MKRVVVTGIGVVSCLGNNQEEVYNSLINSKSGITFSEEYKEFNLKSHVHGLPNIKLEDHVDRKVIRFMGKGGATIREIVEKSGAKVDVNDEGVVTVAAPDEDSRNKAMQMIKDLTAKAELNKIYNGKVMKIMEFGAFVNFLGKQDGLVHISELAPKRVEKVTDVVKEGDEVKVKVIGFDRGKVKLSMKQVAE